ncbi:hypothetical protein Leryth_018053 [Lithospermum erythrorhizon]|nr:hypothetical protein Leryth_018053 [Lithospermum erythrorhizon]
MPNPPRKWRGKCEDGIVCNNKLIGAKSLIDGFSPIDEEGHGTHTSSTAAGNFVENANFFGQASGTSAGIAPRAHVAMYRVCYTIGCPEASMVAGMEAAIDDGVDVMSMSIGGPTLPYHNDTIAIGTFAAMKKGILVSCSAGNSGPYEASMSNDAPWILTVAASTIDRSFRATVVLGNEDEFDGEMINQPKDFPSKQFPLIFLGYENKDAAYCDEKPLQNRTDVVKGKIVVCLSSSFSDQQMGINVRDAGGVGMILINEIKHGYTILADAFDVPTSQVSYAAGQQILTYLNSTTNPTASLVFNGTILGVKEAPMIAFFSSRGPNRQSPGILKPDITGPGVNILAAWKASVDNLTQDNVAFNVISGTSMSCPHLSGVASLIKSYHPDWSPAAIKSAIMTTAYTKGLDGNPIRDEKKQPAILLALGSGHVNPLKAEDPGLVYDIQPDDYIAYLCGLYPDEQVRMIVQSQVECSSIEIIQEAQLNYPSFSIKLGSDKKSYSRTVTNVGKATSTYELILENGSEVDINVSPTKLVFTEVNQKLTYTVTFTHSRRHNDNVAPLRHSNQSGEAAIIWTDGNHSVRSPIYFQR